MKAVFRVLAAVLVAATARADDVQLQAGVARADITPASFMTMYGYANRKCGPANGTHDPLYAKALVLATGESRMAIVTLDLGNIVAPNLGPKVAGALGIPVLLLAASHSHSTPQFVPGSAEQAELESKIFDAVERASKAMFPARLGIARGSLQLGYNRLLPRDDGRSRALFDNLERVPYGPVDPEYILLSVEDTAGAPRALLVHYACHAVVLGPTSCKYSADYPGAMQTKVESQMKGTQCMFVQGGAGDINPLFEGRTGKEDEDFATMQKMGELLADDVLRSAKKIRPTSPMRYPIQAIKKTMTFSDRWDKEKRLTVGVTTVLINREIGIATAPGEPMHKLQTIWKKEAPVRHPLFYGYTYSSEGDWAGYIPDLHSAAHGGYGADVTTRIEIGAGEQIIQQQLINAYKMLEMWRDKPGRP
jgi:neutral ceramidase